MKESASAHSKIKLLIVEDHELTVKGLEKVIATDDKISVIGVSSTFSDGLYKAVSLQPDVILLDLHLPDTRGPRAMVKTFASIPSANVVVLSAEKRSPYVDAVFKSGAYAYVSKEQDLSDVLSNIHSAAQGAAEKTERRNWKPSERLTEAETEIVCLLARGLKYGEIAACRRTTAETIRKQCDFIQVKLELASREQLIAWAAISEYGDCGVVFEE